MTLVLCTKSVCFSQLYIPSKFLPFFWRCVDVNIFYMKDIPMKVKLKNISSCDCLEQTLTKFHSRSPGIPFLRSLLTIFTFSFSPIVPLIKRNQFIK